MDLYLIKTTVMISSKWNAPLFTGKLVKSFLIDVNPKLKEYFRKVRGLEPKLIHISPLYESVNNRVRCVYSTAELDRDKVKKLGKVSINGTYTFYVGFTQTSNGLTFDMIYNTLLNLSDNYIFSNSKFTVELVNTNVINVEVIASEVTTSLFSDKEVSIVFSSPTLLRDPFRRGKYKSLIPTPLNVFSTPLYIYLILTGKYSMKNYYKTLIMIHRLLSETHSIFPKYGMKPSINIRHIYYDEGKIIPALTGYVNYKLNTDEVNNNLREVIQQLIKITTTLGTGTSRASGFGHVIFKNTRQKGSN
jgi:CRISPR-associated endoribonuclease Cas6